MGIVFIIAFNRVKIQMEIGPIWDTFDFLSNAIYFAGQGFGYVDLTRPPVLPLLTSIFFRLGFVSIEPIFILDGIFYIIGVLGLYLLLKLRFNSLESFLGSLLFATFPIVLFFTGLGLSDVPSLTFSIWALYFIIMAVKKNSKFFYLSFLIATMAFLTRYTAGLIIFPMVIYLLINVKHLKYQDIVIGILISSLPIVLTLVFFFYVFKNPFYPFELFYSSTQSSVLPIFNYYYYPDFFYFIKNMPSYIGVSGITIIAFIVIGTIMLAFTKRKMLDENLKKLRKINFKYQLNKTNILFIFTLIVFILSLNRFPFMLSEFLFLGLVFIIYFRLKDKNFRYLDIDLLFLTWFMAFFIFQSVFLIKDDRYFLTMAPAVSFFIILGFSRISQSFDLSNGPKFSLVLSVFIVLIMLISAFSYLPGITQHETLENKAAMDSKQSSQWLMGNDPKYKTKIVYADLGPYFSWYLKMNVKTMPVFMNGQQYNYQIKDYNITKMDLMAYNEELIRNNAEYYFSIRSGLNLTNYKSIKQFGIITIYKKD
jgi:4-amino-4-deoxy-L-arabinose transferase-like glycosyltransferase